MNHFVFMSIDYILFVINQRNIPENFSPSQHMVCLLVLVYFSIYILQ